MNLNRVVTLFRQCIALSALVCGRVCTCPGLYIFLHYVTMHSSRELITPAVLCRDLLSEGSVPSNVGGMDKPHRGCSLFTQAHPFKAFSSLCYSLSSHIYTRTQTHTYLDLAVLSFLLNMPHNSGSYCLW